MGRGSAIAGGSTAAGGGPLGGGGGGAAGGNSRGAGPGGLVKLSVGVEKTGGGGAFPFPLDVDAGGTELLVGWAEANRVLPRSVLACEIGVPGLEALCKASFWVAARIVVSADWRRVSTRAVSSSSGGVWLPSRVLDGVVSLK